MLNLPFILELLEAAWVSMVNVYNDLVDLAGRKNDIRAPQNTQSYWNWNQLA